jgi:hypothetical protein
MIERLTINFKKSPGHFWAWFCFLFIIGLMGLWIPICYKWIKDLPYTIGNIIISGEFSTFAVVALIEGAINIFNMPPSKKKGWPSFYITISLLLILINLFIYYLSLDTNNGKLKVITLIISILSCVFAVLLYGFKNIDIEEDASIVTEEENKEIEANAQESETNPIP